MTITERLIGWSVAYRWVVLALTVVFAGVGVFSFQRMTFDAFPDLTNVQVQVLTSSPGLSAEDMELMVTVPVERAIAGTPGLETLRSLSRSGVSAVTAVFRDGTDAALARQQVRMRLDAALDSIPEGVERPEIAPPITGLGEVVQFTLSSDRHTLQEVTRVLQRDVAPRLRTIPGVVEVNEWGAASPQTDILVDPFAAAARHLSLHEIVAAVQGAIGVVPGGALMQGTEQVQVRGSSNPLDARSLEGVQVRGDADGSVWLRDVARVQPGRVPTVGAGTANGEGEAMFVVVQLLAGADALQVVRDTEERLNQIREGLPEGMVIDVVYDRARLVGSTLHTVEKSLLEGGLLVILVLFLMLGDLRAGLVVASVIPLAMLGAFTGLYLLGFSGNLMSLGAIDFGLIVDGTIVVTESIVGLTMASQKHLAEAVVERTRAVARPVMFAVGILVLVYVPILLMWGTEGKLFRPMALTVLLALVTALVLTFTYIPALASLVIRPKGHHSTWLVRGMQAIYRPMLRLGIRHPVLPGLLAIAVVAGSGVLASRMGVEFVPRLGEGDMVVQTARVPSLTAQVAIDEATRVENLLLSFPEVVSVASRSGAPGLATDPMGMEEADVLIHLQPIDEWTTAHDLEGLMQAFEARLVAGSPGTAFKFTQPIEMRFNELLQGIRADVGVVLYGQDLDELVRLGREIAQVMESIPGAADVVPPSSEGIPELRVDLDPARAAQYGLQSTEILDLVRAVRRGEEAGLLVQGQFRDPVVVRFDLPDRAQLGDLPIPTPGGGSVPLSEVANVYETFGAVTVSRQAGSRRVIIEANVRGRDVGSFVREASERIGAEVVLPDGYWMEWSGKFEQLRDAATRTAIMLPILLVLIVGILWVALRKLSIALLILTNVPVAVSGGIALLWFSGNLISMSAVVGFIALAGVAVMNGIVMLSRTWEFHQTMSAGDAALHSAQERFRPVLTTALVAGIGFVPMAFAHGVGAEVQRPLAIVVIGGLVTCTTLTLLVLPALYARLFRNLDPPGARPAAVEPEPGLVYEDDELGMADDVQPAG